MAFTLGSIVEVRTTGSDSNTGVFSPNVTSMATDGSVTSANTSSPVFSSASYTFISNDVGAYLFIRSGTNAIPGWYKIASVAGGSATLIATIGSVVLYQSNGTGGVLNGLNTVVGCSASSTLSSTQWAVDYSQSDTAYFSLTGLATDGSNNFTIQTTSATKAMIGNSILITGGTNFTQQLCAITSTVAGTSISVDKLAAPGTSVGSGGTAVIGGAILTPGYAGSLATRTSMCVFIKTGTYTITSASTNVSGGCVLGTSSTFYQGYDTSRFQFSLDANRPLIKLDTGVSTATIFTGTNNAYTLSGVILDGNSQTTSRGVLQSGICFNVKFLNFTNGAFYQNSIIGKALFCEATGCSGGVAGQTLFTVAFGWCCSAHDNAFTNGVTTYVFSAGYFHKCISYNNSGTSVNGFGNFTMTINCIAYNNGLHGFFSVNNTKITSINCIAESNGGYGFATNTGTEFFTKSCSTYNNTLGRIGSTDVGTYIDIDSISTASSVFNNAGSADFSLNNTAGVGALLRAMSFPSFQPGLSSVIDYTDIGAYQHQDAGSTVIIGPSWTGGFDG